MTRGQQDGEEGVQDGEEGEGVGQQDGEVQEKEFKMWKKEKEKDELTSVDQSGDLRGINQLQPIQADLPP